MNAITGIENLIAQPSILNSPYWAAYADRVADGNKVRDNYPPAKGGEDSQTDSITIEDSERTLRRFITDLSASGCNLVFWFSDRPRPSKGGYRISFYLPAQTGQPQINAIGSIPQMPAVDIEKTIDERVNAHIDRFMAEQEKRNLQARIKELETQLKDTAETPFDRVIGRLEPFINPLLENMFSPKAAVTATNIGTSKADPNQDQAIAEKALTELAEIEPELPTLLAKLAKLAKEDPGTYNMAKMFLNK